MRLLAWRTLSGCLILVCLIAVLGACGGTTAAARAARPAASPSATTQSVVAVVTGYYRAVVSRNYVRAFGYLTPGATGSDGRRLTLLAFLQFAHMLDGMGGPVTRFSVGAFPPEVVMTLYRVRYGPYHAHLRMARTRHGWAIGAIDRI